MKNKIFGGIAVGVIVVAMAMSANFSSKNNKMTDISLANVEALARGEDLAGKECRYKGSSIYESYIPCTATYPNIGSCGERESSYYSSDTGQCYQKD